KEQPAFQPARPIEGLTLKTVIDAYERKGNTFTPSHVFEEDREIALYLRKMEESFEGYHGNVSLKDI
ncbi:MAG: hypothetical protein N2513_01975, partial [Deltaproteobacteria bacterium]|nr:hypothetical protein [Deltaproteobacteria bacterium]